MNMRKHPEPVRAKKPPRIHLHGCDQGHVFFESHSKCPDCGRSLRPAAATGLGTLIGRTRMAVTPTGQPLQLGIAQWRTGVRTLCRIIGAVRGHGHDRVWLFRLEGIYWALGRNSRRLVPRLNYRKHRSLGG